MTALTLTLKDVLWLGSLLVSVALAFGRLRSEIRHLDDVKSDRLEVQIFSEEIRDRLSVIATSLARVEESTNNWNRVNRDPD
jgi:hypothetical protein